VPSLDYAATIIDNEADGVCGPLEARLGPAVARLGSGGQISDLGVTSLRKAATLTRASRREATRDGNTALCRAARLTINPPAKLPLPANALRYAREAQRYAREAQLPPNPERGLIVFNRPSK